MAFLATSTAGFARGRVLVPSLGAVLLLASVAAAEVRVGDPIPSFSLPDGGGHSVTIESLRGHIVVIDFTASWCVACRTALPALAALVAPSADRGVILLTIDIDGARANADRFLGELGAADRMTVLYDPTARLLGRFGAGGMPALYVVDRSGVVRFVESGYGVDRIPAVGHVIDTLLAGDGTPPDR